MIVKYKCLSRADVTAKSKEQVGVTSVYGDNLYEAKLVLDVIMREHLAKGDKVLYRNRHSLKVETND